MNFSYLQKRLLDLLIQRLRNGEITERGFARQIGVSQPHIHNVLSGRRILSSRMADRILAHLGISVLELYESVEIKKAAETVLADAFRIRMVPLAGGRAGFGDDPPTLDTTKLWVFIWDNEATGWQDLVGVVVGHDPNLSAPFRSGSMALVERNEHIRTDLVEGHWYLVYYSGQAIFRQVTRIDGRWWAGEIPLPMGRIALMSSVLGKAVWVGDDLRVASQLSQRGTFLNQTRAAAASVEAASTSVAVRSQLNAFSRANPLFLMWIRKSSSSNTSRMPLAMSNTFSGFTITAASPTTSGREVLSEQTTGVPQAMASRGGKPKPSYSEGNTKATADS